MTLFLLLTFIAHEMYPYPFSISFYPKTLPVFPVFHQSFSSYFFASSLFQSYCVSQKMLITTPGIINKKKRFIFPKDATDFYGEIETKILSKFASWIYISSLKGMKNRWGKHAKQAKALIFEGLKEETAQTRIDDLSMSRSSVSSFVGLLK